MYNKTLLRYSQLSLIACLLACFITLDSAAHDAERQRGGDMQSPEELLASMGITMKEAEEASEIAKVTPRGERDGRICICGHGVARHTVTNGAVYCKPTRMECPCKKVRAVIEVDDTRPFLRRTAGSGAMHALSLGLVGLAQKGRGAEWIVDLKCDRCGAEDSNVVPAAVTANGVGVSYPTGYDVLLCSGCREAV